MKLCFVGFTPTPAPEGAGLRTLLSEPKANSWLSSADDELENLQESWDSVSKQIIPLDMQSPSVSGIIFSDLAIA